MFAACCWWRSLAVDGCSGTSRGHGSVVRRPGARRDGAVERPFAFQAGRIPKSAWIVRALSAVADSCCLPLTAAVAVTVAVSRDQESGLRRPVLLAVAYLAGRSSRPPPGWNSPTPPPNPTAAEPRDGRVLSRPSSRVHEPCILAGSGCPAVTDGLDRFRESQILLWRVGGRPPTFPPAYSGREPNLTIPHCQLGNRTDHGR
jgi:hypothetical protein